MSTSPIMNNPFQEILFPSYVWEITVVVHGPKDRPCTDIEIFLMTNFPDGPITKHYKQFTMGSDKQGIIDTFNKSDTAMYFNLYAIDAKIVTNFFQVQGGKLVLSTPLRGRRTTDRSGEISGDKFSSPRGEHMSYHLSQ